MTNGGIIAISAQNVRLRPEDAPDHLNGDFVALAVSDTGSGIPPDILSKVFDPFFTTKEVNKGTGLGLSQVHGFAHQSGGTVAIDSDLGKGTVVTLYLPRQHDSPRMAVVESEPLGRGTVLLVEDNPEVAEVSLALLDQLGYQVEKVDRADSALRRLEQRKFDLVISDIVMAGSMDGLPSRPQCP